MCKRPSLDPHPNGLISCRSLNRSVSVRAQWQNHQPDGFAEELGAPTSHASHHGPHSNCHDLGRFHGDSVGYADVSVADHGLIGTDRTDRTIGLGALGDLVPSVSASNQLAAELGFGREATGG